MEILDRASPNFGARHGVEGPSLVVLHHTAMASEEAALARLCDPGPEVSAHYLIGGDGRIWQLVVEQARAWHAGVSYWRGARDINSASVGIELANPAGLCDFPPFGAAQMASLEGLLGQIMARWKIGPDGVLGHSDVAPGRKADPGAKFDWARLARSGLALARPEVPAGGGDPDRFHEHLAAFGYDISDPEASLAAFRLRWRPEALGAPVDRVDAGIAAGLSRWRASS